MVGDDAQSIYSFRAAEIRNILDFPEQFATPAEIVTLDRNYRSTETILAAANAVIGEASERFTKNLWTERRSAERPRLVTVRDEAEQASYVCEKILEEREAGAAAEDAGRAVSCLASQRAAGDRAHAPQHPVREVRRPEVPRRRPCQGYAGHAALRRKPARPRCRLPRAAAFARGRPVDCRAGHRGDGRLARSGAGALGFRAPQRAEPDWPAFVELFSRLRAKSAAWPSDLEYVRLWYEPHLERIHEDAIVRRADLVQLEQIAAGYPSRERFLTDLTLDPPDATSDRAGPPHLDEDYLILSTIHSAKGQEWKNVFVLNVVDGCIPADLGVGTKDEIDEERRLLYVAMTRAKDALHLVMPQRFYPHGQPARGDRHIYASRTRFIPASILDRFESCTWPLQAQCRPKCAPPNVRVDLKSRMRGMWG